VIQAFIFALLTVIYLSMSTMEHDSDSAAEAAIS
jgi:hypothetical protein